MPRKQLAVPIGDLDAAGVEAFQLLELGQAHRGLRVRHAKVEADIVEVQIPVALAHGELGFVEGQILALGIVGQAAQRPERQHALVEVFPVGREHPAFTQRHHVLLLVEAEDSDIAQRSRAAAFVLGAGGVRAIFDHQDVPLRAPLP